MTAPRTWADNLTALLIKALAFGATEVSLEVIAEIGEPVSQQQRGTMSDPKLPFGSNKCRCDACGEYFFSIGAFDMHREGPYAKRFCIGRPAMIEKGMSLSDSGHWTTGKTYGLSSRIADSGRDQAEAATP